MCVRYMVEERGKEKRKKRKVIFIVWKSKTEICCFGKKGISMVSIQCEGNPREVST